MKLELLTDTGRRAQYRLAEPFSFQGITVPAGFVTDFGSVPTALEWLVSGEDVQMIYPSVVHDYLYQFRGEIPEGKWTRLDADRLLVQGMRDLGAPWWKRNVVYAAVRAGGWCAWRN